MFLNKMHITKLRIIILPLLLTIVFFPTYLFGNNTSSGQVVLFAIFPMVLSIAWLLAVAGSKENKFESSFFLNVILFIFGLNFITIISKLDFIDTKDVFNHMRYLCYAFVFSVSYDFARKIDLKLNKLSNTLYVISILSVIFVLLQIIMPNSTFVDLITKKPAIDYLGFRLGGPFEWSYIFSFCLLPTLVMGIYQFTRKEGNFATYAISIFVLIVFLLSQSKAAYLSLLFSSLFLFLFSILKYKNNFRLYFLFFSALSVLIVVVSVYGEMFSHIANFISKVNSGDLDGSTTSRINQLKNVSYTLDNNLIFGYPIKEVIIENAYFHYLYNYGFLGLLAYIILIFSFFCDSILRLYNAIRSDNTNSYIGLHLGMVCFTGSIFIYALGASPTDANKSSYFFYFIYAIFSAASSNYFQIRKRKLN
ncbi:TPA: O-antigen ligase family protein [Vibrio parahaemolyticus]|nr:O-antigen ligase family protein [Vibrio parahaemolyticus]